jgi:tetratricopeptide (TPR) repeat protein
MARGFLQEGRLWLQRALASDLPGPQLHADLHRLLGAVLWEVGEREQAQASLEKGARVAAAAGLATSQARISVMQAEIRVTHQGGADAQALSECEAAAAVLLADGDLDGLAEAWLTIGVVRGARYEPAEEALERGIRYARDSGNYRVSREARAVWLVNCHELPIPTDVAIARGEQFLDEAGPDDLWWQAAMLEPLSVLYALPGRFADARATVARAQSLYRGLETRLTPSCAICAGEIEMIAGNPAAAEPEFRRGCEGLRALGNRGILCSSLALLADAVYAQGRLDEAQELARQAKAISSSPDRDSQTRWRAVRAKVLARRGQFPAARQLADESLAIAAPSSSTLLHAYALETQAEVSSLAGAPEEAAGHLRAALRLYEERRASALADRIRAALASLPAGRH